MSVRTVAATTRLRTVADGGAVQRWYTLGVLIVAYIMAFIDRQILSLLVEPLKRDLHLSDTQISLLQGFAFAVCLAVAGLPLGRLIDRGRRLTVVAIAVAVWSAMTVGCGLASGFLTLLLCRVGVGIGEAGLTPAAHSIVGDLFPPRQLGLALGIFGVGSYVGAGLALLGGGALLGMLPSTGTVSFGALGDWRAWQVVFFVVGISGLPVAVWIASLREPSRPSPQHESLPLGTTIDYFRRNAQAIVRLNLMAAFVAMAVYASGAWIPSFLIRTFGFTIAQSGAVYGLIVIVCGASGTLGGGALGDYLVARGVIYGRPLIMMLAAALAALFGVAAALSTEVLWSIVLLIPFTLLTTISLGILPAAQQAIAHSRVRGLMAAVGVLMVNLVGLGVGPTAIALFTDQVLGDSMLIRYSLAWLLPSMLCCGVICGWWSLGPYRRAVVAAIDASLTDSAKGSDRSGCDGLMQPKRAREGSA